MSKDKKIGKGSIEKDEQLDFSEDNFFKYIQKHKEYNIIDEMLIVEYDYNNSTKEMNFTIIANKLNYGNCIGYFIYCDVPFDRQDDSFLCHPFRLIKNEDRKDNIIKFTGEIVPDNEIIRLILNHISDDNLLKSKWGNTHKTEILAKWIKTLGLFWD